MKTVTITLKDTSKRELLIALLKELNFVSIITEQQVDEDQAQINDSKQDSSHSLFNSAGLFANTEIDATSLRKDAWQR